MYLRPTFGQKEFFYRAKHTRQYIIMLSERNVNDLQSCHSVKKKVVDKRNNSQ